MVVVYNCVVYNCEIELENIQDKSTIGWIKNVGLKFLLKVPFLLVLSLINWFNSQISSSDVKINNFFPHLNSY
jgi:hypothetical protein